MRTLLLLASLPLCAAELQRFEFVEPHMGTLFRITLYAADAELARAASGDAFQRVQELDRTLSDFKPDSELMRVCREAWRQPVAVSSSLFHVLSAAQQLAGQTGGAFDVTQGPVIRLWREARETRRLPEQRAMEEARRLSGYRNLVLDAVNRTVFLKIRGMLIDLGGIAKGYAADEALRTLREHGLTRALVAASGDLAIGDAPPGREGWTIKVEPSGVPHLLVLKNVGVSTSGDAEQFLETDGRRYSHIVDPKSGDALTTGIGVTIIAREAITSDGLATAVSILGAERGMRLINSHQRIGALIASEGAILETGILNAVALNY